MRLSALLFVFVHSLTKAKLLTPLHKNKKRFEQSSNLFSTYQRSGGDSNPRYGLTPYVGLANRWFQPLIHLTSYFNFVTRTKLRVAKVRNFSIRAGNFFWFWWKNTDFCYFLPFSVPLKLKSLCPFRQVQADDGDAQSNALPFVSIILKKIKMKTSAGIRSIN